MNNNNITSSCFSTGKFAKICNTTKNTLFHYDEIGLLKPSITKSNGYRYYSVDQIYTFDIINVLKNCNCSLKEIKDALENNNINTFFSFVNEKKSDLLLQRQRIDNAIKLLEHSNSVTSFALEGETNMPYITHNNSNKYVVVSPCNANDIQSTQETATTLHTHFSMCNNIPDVEKFPLGHIILQQTFNCGELNHAYIYSILNAPLKKNSPYIDKQLTINKGTYLNIKHKGPYETIGNAYQQLFSYIYANNITIKSDIFEENLISYFATSLEEDHVVHIFLQIEPLE